MIAKCPCEHCGVNIEFATEEFLSGSSVKCPECGKETTLYVSPQAKPTPKSESSAESQPPPKPPTQVSSKNLRVCKDCGKSISVHAELCPHCGASFKKRHGVFFYVFWGVVSLFATVFILWIVLAVFLGIGFVAVPAFVAARHEAQIQNGITNSITTTSSLADDSSKQKANYINNSLVLYGFTSKIHDSEFDGKIPGVDFKIKNTGDKTLKKIEVTVYFKDSSGSVIYDEKFYPVLVTEFGTDSEPLKPGYIWQQEQGKFYSVKKVPSEWQEGNADAKITDIKFAD